MKYLGVGLIWIGYGIAVVGVSFGTKDATAAMFVGIAGALFAALATERYPR